ncbi:MAG: hypothetical protein RIG62_26770 [Cyclobacteriaceae bacterium]
MNELQDLIQIIRKKGHRSIQLVNFNFRKKETSKDNQLYQGILNETFTSDDEAAKTLFEADPGNRNYRNAKSKLKSKLLNHLFFLDYDKESYTSYEQCRYDCERTLQHAKILTQEKSDEIAQKLLPPLIRTATEFELYDILVSALELEKNYHSRQGKITPFLEARAAVAEYRLKLRAYQSSEDLFYETLVHIHKSVSAQKRVLDTIPKTIEQIHHIADRVQSESITIIGYKLSLLYYQLNWDYDKTLELCTQLEDRYLNCPNSEINVNLNQKEIVFTKLYSYIYLEEVVSGIPYAKRKQALFKPSHTDWFSFMEYYLLLLMKGEQYKDAAKVFRKVRTNKNFNNLSQEIRDRWAIYRVYLIYFNDTKILRWGFNLEEFLQAKPEYPKEYESFNIASLTIQFMFLLRNGNINELKQCVGSMSQFKSSHLDKRNNYRSSVFIRLLEIVIEKDFDFDRVQEKGNTYYQKLADTKIPSDLEVEIEVVPYERLWIHVLRMLKSNKAYIHYQFYNVHAM